jgi:hypothetical protein
MSTQNIFDLTDTWNAGGTTFTAIKMSVTDTASAAGSLLMDLQVGGVSKFNVLKSGYIRVPNCGNVGTSVSGASVALASASNNGLYIGNGWAGFQLNSGSFFTFTDFNFVMGTAVSFGWSSGAYPGFSALNQDLILARDAANTLAQRNGTNAQTFRIANTFTDASNYERGKIEWASNVLRIGTEKAGTGTARALELQTDGVTRLTIPATSGAAVFAAAVQSTKFQAGASALSSGLAATTNQTSLLIDCPGDGIIAISRENVSTGNIRFGASTTGNGVAAFEFGSGAWSATPSTFTLTGASGAGTNIAGANFTILGGVSTGSAAGGAVILSVTPAGSSGTARNSSAEVLRITPTQLVTFGGTTSSFPALKRSTTSLQVRLADDTAFTNIQGKITTETAYTAGAPTATGYLVLYDSNGTAYKIPAEAV